MDSSKRYNCAARTLRAAGEFAALSLLAACGSSAEPSSSREGLTAAGGDGGAQVPFEILLETEETTCGFGEPSRLVQEVIRDEAAFRAAFRETRTDRPLEEVDDFELPAVDFESSVVIGAVAWRTTDCRVYVEITSVREFEQEVRVDLAIRNPCFGLGVLAWPYVFAELPRIDKPFVFTQSEVQEECPE